MSEFTDEIQLFYPMQVDFDFGGSPVRSAATSGVSCIVCTDEGDVFTWGSMFLGSGPTVMDSTRPLHLSSKLFADSIGRNGRVRRVMAGISTIAAINEEDCLFTWGSNRHGSLALCHDKDQLFPFQVDLPNSVKTVALGPDHTIILVDTKM
jgi:alpha-tubulin suppressor-like RCC1 family protein